MKQKQKSNISSTKEQMDEQINSLSKQLKQKNQKYPKLNNLNITQSRFTKPINATNHQDIQPITYQPPTNTGKRRINWNHSAQAWTREKSPSHSIPKSKRFSNPQPHFESPAYPELYLNLRTKLGDQSKGVSFAKSLRPKLFTVLPNPSPNQYQTRRYLQNSLFSAEMMRSRNGQNLGNSRSNPEGQLAQTYYHIKGGTINKFGNHELLYYPHTKKLNYNDKKIAEQFENKKIKLQSNTFRVRKNNNSLNI